MQKAQGRERRTFGGFYITATSVPNKESDCYPQISKWRAKKPQETQMIDSPHLQKIRELIVVWSLKTCWIFVAYLVATRSMFEHHLALKGLLPSCLYRVLHSSKACDGSVVLVAKSCTQKVRKRGLTVERPLTCRVVINASIHQFYPQCHWGFSIISFHLFSVQNRWYMKNIWKIFGERSWYKNEINKIQYSPKFKW